MLMLLLLSMMLVLLMMTELLTMAVLLNDDACVVVSNDTDNVNNNVEVLMSCLGCRCVVSNESDGIYGDADVLKSKDGVAYDADTGDVNNYVEVGVVGDDVVNIDVIDVNNNVCAVDNYGVGVSCG